MKTEFLTGAFAKLAGGVALAATLAGGTAVIKAAETNAVQDVRIERIEKVSEKMDDLNKTMADTKTEVALLRKELENNESGKQ